MSDLNVLDFIEQTCERFTQAKIVYGHGTTNAFDEAVWLTLWGLKQPLDDLESIAENTLTQAQIATLNSLVEQRINTRKPMAYLTKEAWLQGIDFYVDERSIVPRSLIAEVLADGAIDEPLDKAVVARKDTVPHILDLCTGNGSLAILCALAWPDALVCGADIDADALEVAHINVKRHHLQNRVTLTVSDGLNAPTIKKHAPFDLIVCNPPYVNAKSIKALPAEYQAEPLLAFAGGDDGMDFIRPLLAQASQFLTKKGFLVLEIGHERPYFEAAFPNLDVLWLETSAGEDQVLLLTRETLLHQP